MHTGFCRFRAHECGEAIYTPVTFGALYHVRLAIHADAVTSAHPLSLQRRFAFTARKLKDQGLPRSLGGSGWRA